MLSACTSDFVNLHHRCVCIVALQDRLSHYQSDMGFVLCSCRALLLKEALEDICKDKRTRWAAAGATMGLQAQKRSRTFTNQGVASRLV